MENPAIPGDHGTFTWTSARGWRWAGRRIPAPAETWIITAPEQPAAGQYAIVRCTACNGPGYVAHPAPAGDQIGYRDIGHASSIPGAIQAVEDELVHRTAAPARPFVPLKRHKPRRTREKTTA